MNPNEFRIGAFMVSQGFVHKVMADITQPRAEQVLGMPITRLHPGVLSEQDPWEAKLAVLRHAKAQGFDHVLLLDTDIVLHSWDWGPIKPHHFNAVATWQKNWAETIGMRKLVPAPWPLFNTGLWLAPTSMVDVMQYARELSRGELKNFEFKFWEETPLNTALYRKQAPVNELPAGFNTLHHNHLTLGPMPVPGIHAVHFVEANNKLGRVYRYSVAYPLSSEPHKEYRMAFRDDCLYNYMRTVKKNSSNKKVWTWLDLGAGRGQVSQMLSKIMKSNKYHCIDVEPYHKLVKRFDGQNIPFGPGTFDFIVINFVLHHAKEKLEALLTEARRVLKPEGFLVIQEDVLDGTKVVADLCHVHEPGGRFMSLKGWRRKLLRQGFNVVHTEALPPFFEDLPGGYDVPRALMIATISPLPQAVTTEESHVQESKIPPQPTPEGSALELGPISNDSSTATDTAVG